MSIWFRSLWFYEKVDIIESLFLQFYKIILRFKKRVLLLLFCMEICVGCVCVKVFTLCILIDSYFWFDTKNGIVHCTYLRVSG